MTFEFTIIKNEQLEWTFEDYPYQALWVLRLDAILHKDQRKEFGIEMSLRQFIRPEGEEGWLRNPILNVIKVVTFCLGDDEKKIVPKIIDEVKRVYLTQGPGKVSYTILK